MRQAREDWRNHRYKRAVTGFVRREWHILAFIAGFISFAVLVIQVQHFSTELRDGLVESCKQNGNPLRKAVTQQLRDQIRQSHTVDYSRYFPGIPPDELQALIDEANERRRGYIEDLQPVDCESLYP